LLSSQAYSNIFSKMAKMATTAALLAAPAAAFVPIGQLRATSSQLQEKGATQAQAEQSSTGYIGASLATAAIVTGAAAMRPRQRRTEMRSQFFPNSRRSKYMTAESGGLGREGVYTDVGVSAPVDFKFDPLNLGNTDAKMDRYTQVEIKHGRIAMVACVGYIMPEVFRFPGCENFKHGLAALNSIPLEGWIQLVAFVGAHEVLVKPRESAINPMDFGFGKEIWEAADDKEKIRKQTVERNNGRLAMVAIMGMMWQDGQFGMPPIESLSKYGWWGPGVSYLVEDLPLCAALDGYPGNAYICAQPKTRETSRIAMRAQSDGTLPISGLKIKDWDNAWGDDALPKKWDSEPEMSAAVPFLKYPYMIKGYVGEEKGFDPLGISETFQMYWLREAELKHGRVCMLATVGWIAVDSGVRFSGEKFQAVPDAMSAVDYLRDQGALDGFFYTLLAAELMGHWFVMAGGSNEIKREAGDFFIGKQFLPSDPEKEKDMRLKELENGRLAMLAISGIITQAGIYGGTWPFM